MENNRVAIGVDIGGTNIRVAKITSSGEILEHASEKMPRGKDAQLAILKESVQKFLSPEIQAIGLGFPGRLRVTDGIVVSAGFLELKNINLLDILKEQTKLPSIVDSDSNMAAFGEMCVGTAVGEKEVVMLTIGTGIGGSIISDGKLFYGGGFAAQLGHITIDVNGEPCPCGRRGCVETTSSGTAFRRLIAQSTLPSNTLIEDLLRMDKTGDSLAHEMLLKWAFPLRLAIDSMVATTGCELVVLGGGLGKAACEALEQVTRAESSWFTYKIKPGKLGDKAGVIGSGLRAFTVI